jgi:hypothetical protein
MVRKLDYARGDQLSIFLPVREKITAAAEPVVLELESKRIGPAGYSQAELDAARLEAARLGYGLGLRPARARAETKR